MIGGKYAGPKGSESAVINAAHDQLGHAPKARMNICCVAVWAGARCVSLTFLSLNGGAAANILGICGQNVITSVYWSSGPSRTLRLGKRAIVLRHVPPWQLSAADRPAGLLLRALVWIESAFPQETEKMLEEVAPGLAAIDREEFASLQGVMPAWLAQPVSRYLGHG